MTRPLLPLFILLLSTVSVAQDPVKLTFTDCLAIAREQSTDAINATLTYKEAAMEYKAFRRSLYPQVSLAINSPGYSKSFSAINLDAWEQRFSPAAECLFHRRFESSPKHPLDRRQYSRWLFHRTDIFLWRF
jgi:hypothetical protein